MTTQSAMTIHPHSKRCPSSSWTPPRAGVPLCRTSVCIGRRSVYQLRVVVIPHLAQQVRLAQVGADLFDLGGRERIRLAERAREVLPPRGFLEVDREHERL